MLHKRKSFQVESGFIYCSVKNKVLWVLKDGEVILEPQGGPVCQREKDRNLQVSLMTSCIWFGSCPKQKGGEGEMMSAAAVSSQAQHIWALLFIMQMPAAQQYHCTPSDLEDKWLNEK